MPELLVGPLLRYVGETEATVWVETDAACEVSVLGHSARTFNVAGHHYALVHVEGLEPGTTTAYQVALDGEQRWPQPSAEFPPSAIRTKQRGKPLKLIFGSCRVTAPHEPPHSLSKDKADEGREVDALYALVLRMRHEPSELWPHALVLLGDQVYADEVSPEALEFIRSRRDTDKPPGEEIADFEEYTRLYREAWTSPSIRWLLSTVPSAMIFDDHDVHDDWNTSHAWTQEMRAKPWWHERIVSAYMSYWLYQHLGNLAPGELREDELYNQVVGHEGDAEPVLREFAERAERETEGTRWSYCRDLAGTRLVMMDSRAGRVLEGRRCMIDDEEWGWIEQQARGDFDHLLLGTSLPFLLGGGMHYLEAWNEAVCDGAWGKAAAKLGEKARQGLDLEHWAAFGDSFERVCGLLEAVGSGEHGEAPASIVLLSGDVHHAYLAEVAFRRGAGVESSVYQAVCSPFRNPLDTNEIRAIRVGLSRGGEFAGRALAHAAGVPDPPIRWRFREGPWFDNQVATLLIDGRRMTFRIEKTLPPEESEEPTLECVVERRLA